MTSKGKRLTPLQPKEFFRGKWEGEGEIAPSPLLRWLYPKEKIRYFSEAEWLTDTIWLVRDRHEFASGAVIHRKMFVEQVAPDRLHATADDMPLGADIILHEKGFRFVPYYVWSGYRGRKWLVKCHDECVLDDEGLIHDTIKMYYWGLQVATMHLVFKVNREPTEE